MDNNKPEIGCEASRQAKHDQLLAIYHQLDDLINHIEDLNRRLGVSLTSEEPSPVPVPEPNLDTLVGVLDALPSMVGIKFSKGHRLLNDLEENLI